MEEVVDVGELSAEAIHLPNIFVDRIMVGERFEKRIEKRTLRKREEGGGGAGGGKGAELRERIVRRAALEFKDGMFGECVEFDWNHCNIPVTCSKPWYRYSCPGQ